MADSSKILAARCAHMKSSIPPRLPLALGSPERHSQFSGAWSPMATSFTDRLRRAGARPLNKAKQLESPLAEDRAEYRAIDRCPGRDQDRETSDIGNVRRQAGAEKRRSEDHDGAGDHRRHRREEQRPHFEAATADG